MGNVSPCHVSGLEHLYPGRNLHLPTPIISPFCSLSLDFPTVLEPSTHCNWCHGQCFRAQPDTSAMLDTLFSTKFPLGFQGRPGPDMSKQEGMDHSFHPLITPKALAQQERLLDEEGGGVGREEVGGGSQCPVPSLLLPRGHSCSDNLYSETDRSPGRTGVGARHSLLCLPLVTDTSNASTQFFSHSTHLFLKRKVTTKLAEISIGSQNNTLE